MRSQYRHHAGVLVFALMLSGAACGGTLATSSSSLGALTAATPCGPFRVTGAARVRWSRCPQGIDVYGGIALDSQRHAWVRTTSRGVPVPSLSRLDADGNALWTAKVPWGDDSSAVGKLATDGRSTLLAFGSPRGPGPARFVFVAPDGAHSPRRDLTSGGSVGATAASPASGLFASYVFGLRDDSRRLSPDRLVALTRSGVRFDTALPDGPASYGRVSLAVHRGGAVAALDGGTLSKPHGALTLLDAAGDLIVTQATSHGRGVAAHPSGFLLLRARCDAERAGAELSLIATDGREVSRRCFGDERDAWLAADEVGNAYIVDGSIRGALRITALSADGSVRGKGAVEGCDAGWETQLSAARGELLLVCHGAFKRAFLAELSFEPAATTGITGARTP